MEVKIQRYDVLTDSSSRYFPPAFVQDIVYASYCFYYMSSDVHCMVDRVKVYLEYTLLFGDLGIICFL